ncbi:MAG: hypothetical protein GFH27_549289n112 [Chloroflexi bacterium AL-W]|nr:hypothetical protein [Chloroflexi bacterium AL-N1]NOK66844.1 hypothetical protein [Chloroflexi bacterium AL-N10]NOK74864.1 hypothetical protein [Chloroflexi bacterium AL-N5]NOK81447.1 hypothetical protein [Chloroflexi bacterium AL-W]NOK88916.1 hypothetical protein [Chloroflexi bacterium AL-N15]
MSLLQRYRKDTSLWTEIAFRPARNDERGDYDANEHTRLKAILELQYDLKDADLELVRFLFSQEIVARRHDSFQECGEALSLGAYLLARFRDPVDIPLFVQAKFANFDTFCGFSSEYIFAALREQTEPYLEANFPEILQQLKENDRSLTVPEHLDEWWQALAKAYPESEKHESLLSLYERSLMLDEPEKALHYLETWIAQEPESESKLQTMRYSYRQLGKFEQAAATTRSLLDLKKTLWDQTSLSHDLMELYCQAELFDEAIAMARHLDTLLSSSDEWIGYGLGRMTIHNVCKLALAHPDLPAAQEAFALADHWFARSNDLALVGRETAVQAAERCELEEKNFLQ